ncbi:MAG: methionine--tRNA ligase [Verrucomicrobia bacterium]|nr:methionine--tRNA ligase [Verrucomicrobiota bacterium]
MRYFVTTAIAYTNGDPHIGHAYEIILGDVIGRYHRTFNGNAFFLTGVDQHGQKVQQAAQKIGVAPYDFVRGLTDKFLALWNKLEIQKDGWAATTDPRHKRAVQKVLQELYDRGQLFKQRYSGYYSVRQEQFLTDKERNEQGEFGPEWGEVIFFEEENWYFPLAKHKEWLRNFVETHPHFVIPEFRRQELLNAIDRLSGDLCVSRPKERLSWGIEFPFDPDYVTFVWFDALLNYLTFAGYLAEPGSGLPDFGELWPCRGHIIGKDIMVPAHGIYWPIMLHAMQFSDVQMPRLVVHGWWNVEGHKMSKSLGNVIDPDTLADAYGPEALRYYLMRDVVTGHDADFSEERLVLRYNTDLANDLGNLINRTINMSQRYRKGVLAQRNSPVAGFAEHTSRALANYRDRFEQYMVNEAIEAAWDLVSRANALVEQSAPWHMAKDPGQKDQLDAVLYTLAETCRILALLVSPILPSAAERILSQLNASDFRGTAWGELPDGHVLGLPTPIFPRIEQINDY